MHFTIVIPTFQRIKKLQRCINSIFTNTHKDFDVYVIADNNDIKTKEVLDNYYKENTNVHTIVNPNHSYVMGCWNLFTKDYYDKIKDYMVWIVDDTEMLPDCLKNLNECCTTRFPDKDGMVGISQVYPLHTEAKWKENGQCAIGKNFILKFPDRQVCCVDYVHFYQDEEVLEYAKSINKFVLCRNAELIHHHPAFYSNEMDETHKIPRGETHDRDRATYLKRKHKDLIWGKSWELVNE